MEVGVMAGIGTVDVQCKFIRPEWDVVCVALFGHASRALSYLEAGRQDLALEALQDAQRAMQVCYTIESPLPNGCEHE